MKIVIVLLIMALMMISVGAKGGGGGHGGSGHGGGGAADGAGSNQDGNGAITKGRIIPAALGHARPHNSNASNLSDSWFYSIMCLSLSLFLFYVSSSCCS